MTRTSVVALFTMLLLLGCARGPLPIHVQVNGFQNKDMSLSAQATYVVLPISGSENDLAFKEYARMVSKKMNQLGFRQAESKSADIAVFIAYGIDNGTTISSTSSVPVYGSTGGGMSSYSGMTSTGQVYSGTIMSQPTYGVVGSETVTSHATVYNRTFLVDVVDYKRLLQDGTTASFWKGEITSRGVSDNLRYAMPALIEAGFRTFGRNTTEKIVLSPLDPSVENLKEVK